MERELRNELYLSLLLLSSKPCSGASPAMKAIAGR